MESVVERTYCSLPGFHFASSFGCAAGKCKISKHMERTRVE